MGNTNSASSQKTSKCNSCSQNGLYFSFGKRTDEKLYALIKGKQRRVYVDSKGRYYKENSKKKYLPKGTRTRKLSPKKVKLPKRKLAPKGPKGPKSKPKRYYLRKKVKSPLRKTVKDKKKRTMGTRLSARAVFNEMGMNAIGKSFRILQPNGTYKTKYLRLKQNGSPYFANNFGSKHPNDISIKLNIPQNKNWLRGPYPGDDMTGLKNSWPNYGHNISPAGVAQPFRTSLLPRISSGTRRRNNYGNNFGKSRNVPHMHYGKMCFGA